jgi:ACS family glucarate transporter-like MFS transporter
MKPSRARYWVIVFAVTLAILSYIDRVAISQAAPTMSRDLHLDKQQMGFIFGAFALSYSLFEIPSGWLGDYMGPRSVLIRIVLAWSSFTALTGAAWNFLSLWVIRFCFGAGEAGCFPNLTKAFSVWLPIKERSQAQGIMWSFARWGGAFTPPLVVLAFRYMSWRWAFVTFGAMGLVWCFFFARWFRDRPADHPSVNAGEIEVLKEVSALAASHGDVPWEKLITRGSFWLLCLQYFCMSFGWYFYITWLPTYLQEFRHQLPEAASRLAILPLLFGGFGSMSCGLLAARAAQRFGGIARSRRLIGTCALLGAGAMLVVVTQIEDALLAMLAMGMASFANDLVMPPSWNSVMDIGGKYAGTVAGSMNMMGNMAGFVAPVIGGVILHHTNNNWNLLIYLMAGVYVVGAACWSFIDPVTPLEPVTESEQLPSLK